MTSYELSISPDYVPTWGVVEAIRELFQNALDEETRDPDNKMFFSYDFANQTLLIGNKHSTLSAKSLLLGYTEKRNNADMIGSHGEGYKIATVVLLRLNKEVVFYNYGCRQIWRPRFVKSRKYGALVPTFFVEKKAVWESVPSCDLIVKISGITLEEYNQIKACNLHIVGGDYKKITTKYGDILTEEKYRSKVFVGGLYICEDPEIDIGVDFLPSLVTLERDRTMVNNFDLRYYVSKMIEDSGDIDLLTKSLSTRAGEYIRYYNVSEFGDEIAKSFLDEHGLDAVPVAEQKDSMFSESKNTVIVSQQMRDLIRESTYYQEHFQLEALDETLLSTQLVRLGEAIRDRISDTEATKLLHIVEGIREMEKRTEQHVSSEEV